MSIDDATPAQWDEASRKAYAVNAAKLAADSLRKQLLDKQSTPVDDPPPVVAGYKLDAEKPDPTLIPAEAILGMAEVLTHALNSGKYPRDNWKGVPDGRMRYLAAAFRHLLADLKGEKLDPESGLPHVSHALCCLAFVSYFDTSK